MYLGDTNKKNLLSIVDVFTHKSCPDVFQETTPYRRFQFLCHFVSFDDALTPGERWKVDKYSCFCQVFEYLNVRNAVMRLPPLHVIVDETLYPYRGATGLCTYNPSKPARYGLLIISLRDGEVPYTYTSLPYAGKPENPDKYYVVGTDEKTQYLVKRLLEHTNLTGRNISVDRYFTSVPLSEWLLDRNVTLVGTMNESRVGIPHEIRAVVARESKSTIYMYNPDNAKEKMLISWIDKKKRGSKNILCLTTMHDSVKVSRDIRKKPHPLVFYDKTKGGVDIDDYVSVFLSTRMKSLANERLLLHAGY